MSLQWKAASECTTVQTRVLLPVSRRGTRHRGQSWVTLLREKESNIAGLVVALTGGLHKSFFSENNATPQKYRGIMSTQDKSSTSFLFLLLLSSDLLSSPANTKQTSHRWWSCLTERGWWVGLWSNVHYTGLPQVHIGKWKTRKVLFQGVSIRWVGHPKAGRFNVRVANEIRC